MLTLVLLVSAPAQARNLREPARARAQQLDSHIGTALDAFYAERRGRHAWLRPKSFWRRAAPTARVDELLAALDGAERFGLDPQRYRARELRERVETAYRDGEPDEKTTDALELALSEAFLTLASDLSRGRVDPKRLGIPWHGERPEPELAPLLERALGRGVGDALTSAEPPHPEYRRLVESLARAREQKAAPADLERIALNLERWRWAPRELGARHVRVNVPAFALALHEPGGRLPVEMRVVVGQEGWGTPILSDAIESIELNPYWNVPSSIAVEELVPKLRDDPELLAEQDYEVVSGWNGDAKPVDVESVDWDDFEDEDPKLRIRQRPGPANQLGRIKFVLPNPLNIYLHDTPAQQGFERSDRDLSHGCIRLERPLDLAFHLLRGHPDWSPDAIRRAVDSGKHTEIRLAEPVPVHLFYWTAVAREDGSVETFDDLYGIDEKLRAALAKR